ncbi:glycosyltransferase family 29 protein [Profundibacter sp.]
MKKTPKHSEQPADTTTLPGAETSPAQKAPPTKRTLIARLLDPQPELTSASDPKVQLARTLFLWSKGAHAGQLLEISPEMEEIATPQERLMLAALLLEAGRMTQATALAAQTYRDTSGLIDTLRYPALTLALSRMQADVVAHLPLEVAALERYVAAPDMFRNLVLGNVGSIAVVGNAPALLNEAKGSEIDGHKVVIRFNNFQTGPEIRANTGNRTTVWFRMPHLHSVWRRDRADFALTASSGQAALYRVPNAQDLIVEADMRSAAFQYLPHTIYHQLRLKHSNSAPSLGLFCLAWLHDILGSLQDVSIYGFTMVDQPAAGGTLHYFDQGHPDIKHPHDWPSEYRTLTRLAPNRFAPQQPDQAQSEISE